MPYELKNCPNNTNVRCSEVGKDKCKSCKNGKEEK